MILYFKFNMKEKNLALSLDFFRMDYQSAILILHIKRLAPQN
jgi:hypothetical protein